MAKLDDIENGVSATIVDKEKESLTTSPNLPCGLTHIQTSSCSPSIRKHSTQSRVESKDGLPTVSEFEELVNAKAQLLRKGYEREKALKNLCVLSLDHARMVLYRDYIRILPPDYEMTSEDWTQIRLHLEQYGKHSVTRSGPLGRSIKPRERRFTCFAAFLGRKFS
jgi:hypothetical protein